jgi:hypothetical protein
LIGYYLKFKTYILTIRYNVDEDKPDFIKEELIAEDDNIIEVQLDEIEDLNIEDLKELRDIGIT